MVAGGWVLTEGSIQFPGGVEITGPIISEDPVKTGGENGPIKETIRMSAGIHFT